jgi:hypothetical protein
VKQAHFPGFGGAAPRALPATPLQAASRPFKIFQND